MKRLGIIAVGAIFALAACGAASSAPTPTTPATGQGAPPPATSSAPAPATAQPATAAPTVAPPAGVRKIAIVGTNDLFEIQTLDLKLGETVDFVITNKGDEKHNLVGAGEGVKLVSPDVDGGQTITYRWTAPATAMTFKVVCAYHPTATFQVKVGAN